MTVLSGVLAIMGIAYGGDSLGLQLAAFLAACILGYCLVPLTYAGVVALNAPRKQRNEARRQIRLERSKLAEAERHHTDALTAESAVQVSLRDQLIAKDVNAHDPDTDRRNALFAAREIRNELQTALRIVRQGIGSPQMLNPIAEANWDAHHHWLSRGEGTGDACRLCGIAYDGIGQANHAIVGRHRIEDHELEPIAVDIQRAIHGLDVLDKQLESATPTGHAAFPKLHLELIKFSWRDEGKNQVIILPVNVTNREDGPVSLQFELGIERDHRSPQWVKRYEQVGMPAAVMHHNVLPPIGVGGRQTERCELKFWVATDMLKRHTENVQVLDEKRKSLRPETFKLRVTDYVSGAAQVRSVAVGEIKDVESP